MTVSQLSILQWLSHFFMPRTSRRRRQLIRFHRAGTGRFLGTTEFATPEKLRKTTYDKVYVCANLLGDTMTTIVTDIHYQFNTRQNDHKSYSIRNFRHFRRSYSSCWLDNLATPRYGVATLFVDGTFRWQHGRVWLHLPDALKVTHPFRKRRFRQISLNCASAVRFSENSLELKVQRSRFAAASKFLQSQDCQDMEHVVTDCSDCCQHQLWRLQPSRHLKRDWTTGAWMWSSKRQLLSTRPTTISYN